MPHVIRGPPSDAGVVVGGGPAGLEAARVVAERGHGVVLFEATDALGGQLKLAARVTWREALSGIVRWLEYRVRKLGVDVRLGEDAKGRASIDGEPRCRHRCNGRTP